VILNLVPHPEMQKRGVDSIEVAVVRTAPDTLTLRFHLSGAIDEILIPSAESPQRTDGLWQHTCFEAFIGEAHGTAYHELNLSPSTEWAAYRFDGYRSGMAIALADPGISFRSEGDTLELSAVVHNLSAEAPWNIGLSAVIEAKDGTKS
jgi:hypothetical protein